MGLFGKKNVREAKKLVKETIKRHKKKLPVNQNVEEEITALLEKDTIEDEILNVLKPLLTTELQEMGIRILRDIAIRSPPKNGIFDFLLELFFVTLPQADKSFKKVKQLDRWVDIIISAGDIRTGVKKLLFTSPDKVKVSETLSRIFSNRSIINTDPESFLNTLVDAIHSILKKRYSQYSPIFIEKLKGLSLIYLQALVKEGYLPYFYENSNEIALLTIFAEKFSERMAKEKGVPIKYVKEVATGLGEVREYKNLKISIFTDDAYTLLRENDFMNIIKSDKSDVEIYTKALLIIALAWRFKNTNKKKYIAEVLENLMFKHIITNIILATSIIMALGGVYNKSGNMAVYNKLKPFLCLHYDGLVSLVIETIGYIFEGTNNKDVLCNIIPFLYDTSSNVVSSAENAIKRIIGT